MPGSEKKYQEFIDARREFMKSKGVFRRDRNSRNAKLKYQSFKDGKLKNCTFTLVEWRKVMLSHLKIGVRVEDAFIEASNGCLELFEYKTSIFDGPKLETEVKKWEQYWKKPLGNSWYAFYLVHLKDGFVYYPLSHKNFLDQEVDEAFKKREIPPTFIYTELESGDYVVPELHEYFTRVLKHYEDGIDLPENHIKKQVLKQVIKTIRLEALF